MPLNSYHFWQNHEYHGFWSWWRWRITVTSLGNDSNQVDQMYIHSLEMISSIVSGVFWFSQRSTVDVRNRRHSWTPFSVVSRALSTMQAQLNHRNSIASGYFRHRWIFIANLNGIRDMIFSFLNRRFLPLCDARLNWKFYEGFRSLSRGRVERNAYEDFHPFLTMSYASILIDSSANHCLRALT